MNDIFIDAFINKGSLSGAKTCLGKAARQLEKAEGLGDVRYEDAAGRGYLFSGGLETTVGDLARKAEELAEKIGTYTEIMNQGIDELREIDASYGDDSAGGKLLMKFLGKAGFFGGLLVPGVNVAAGWKVSDLPGGLSLMKNANSFLKTADKWLESNRNLNLIARTGKNFDKTRYKRLFGLNSILPSKGTWAKAGCGGDSWMDAFRKNWDKTDSLSDSVKGWKIAGVALNLIGNGISNIDEYKRGDIGGGRAVAETVTETAIDIGKDFLIGAAVTAGIAATIGSAPVVAVGVATVAVSAGLDFVTKKITYAVSGEEKGFTEWASDAILDGAKAVGKAAKNSGKKLAGIVKNALPKVTLPSKQAPGFSLGRLFG